MSNIPKLPAGELVLERLSRVSARVGLGKSEIYRRVGEGRFPVPLKLGSRASAWNAAEVDQWIADRLAERDARKAA